MRRRSIRPLAGVAASVIALGVLLVGVFPTRTLLAQRRDISSAQEELRAVEATNEELADRVEALGTDAEIERIAREQYRLVYPGEEPYALLPPPPLQLPVPDAWPFRGLHAAVEAQAAPPADGEADTG